MQLLQPLRCRTRGQCYTIREETHPLDGNSLLIRSFRGGPGVSGVQNLLAFAAEGRSIVGANYDIIGFDPRGIGMRHLGVEPVDDYLALTVCRSKHTSGQLLNLSRKLHSPTPAKIRRPTTWPSL